MGRKSSLTDDQWVEVERRHLVDGVSINALAQEFGVNESSLRRRIKPNKAEPKKAAKSLLALAEMKVEADAKAKHFAEQLGALPFAKQQIVSDLARKLTNTSEHMASAAEISAASSHRLSRMANQQLELVDEVDPMKTRAQLESFAALQKLANISGEMPGRLAALSRGQPPEPPPSQEEVDQELALLLGSGGG
jgi:transposase-like protein